MVSIMHLDKTITGIIWRQGEIVLRVEVDAIEGMGAYWRISFGGGTELIPPDLYQGYQVLSHSRV